MLLVLPFLLLVMLLSLQHCSQMLLYSRKICLVFLLRCVHCYYSTIIFHKAGAGTNKPLYVQCDGLTATNVGVLSYARLLRILDFLLKELAPNISDIIPDTLSTAGGQISITGYNFGPYGTNISILIGKTLCNNVTIVNEHSLLQCNASAGMGYTNLTVCVAGQIVSRAYAFSGSVVTVVVLKCFSTSNFCYYIPTNHRWRNNYNWSKFWNK